MRRMFVSATAKLTVWYLLILMLISLIFSVIVFQVATREIRTRLETFQIRLETGQEITLPGALTLTDVRLKQTREARFSIMIGLIYVNIAILGLGGIGSYLLAKRTLKPIEEAHEAQSRFTSDASHELRTPLASMKSEIEVALREPKISKPELQELLRSNLEEVDKLSNLSQALLQLSRLNYSDVPLRERVDIVQLSKETLEWYDPEMKRTKLKVPNAPMVIEGNEVTIRDVLRIVIDNAFKYSPNDSTISVSLSNYERSAHITVRNRGQQIPDKDLIHLFDRFYRIDQSRTGGERSGYGLGLALAKQIVQLHKGTIQASSSNEGITTITIELPKIQKK